MEIEVRAGRLCLRTIFGGSVNGTVWVRETDIATILPVLLRDDGSNTGNSQVGLGYLGNDRGLLVDHSDADIIRACERARNPENEAVSVIPRGLPDTPFDRKIAEFQRQEQARRNDGPK